MSYLIFHHGAYYFQIRVPSALQPRYGAVARIHLQTNDAVAAKALALRLAGEWLLRFQVECSGLDLSAEPTGADASAQPQPSLLAGASAAPMTISPTEPRITHAAPRQQRGAKPIDDATLYRAWDRLDPDRAASTRKDMQAAIRVFRKDCKKPLTTLVRSDLAAFRDKQLSRRLARKTVSKRIGMISTLLQVALDAGWLEVNCARGMKVPKSEVPTLVRRIFTAPELERLFALPFYRRQQRPLGAGGEACVWFPMIALASGARLEEIAQLRLDDIYTDPDHGPFFNITDQGEGQRLKNAGSRRTIPVHGALIEAGFLEYVEAVRQARCDWLFPALEADHDGRRGANFGKWFMRQLRSPQGLNISDPRLVFHSFRHTFKTLCRAASIAEDVHDALTGHVSGSVSRTYGEMPVAPLVDAMRKIRLPATLPRIVEGVRHD